MAPCAPLYGSVTCATASFPPFHYGYWDTPAGHRPDGAGRAANEATVTDWDPVSKQPIYKTCAARITLIERGVGRPAPAPTVTASAPVGSDGTTAATGERSSHATEIIVGEEGRQ